MTFSDEDVEMWAAEFSGLAYALAMVRALPTFANVLNEPVHIPSYAAPVVLSLSALLVRSYEKLRGSTPLTPLSAAWLLIAMQYGSVELNSRPRSRMSWLRCFLPFSRRAAKVPLKEDATASIESVSIGLGVKGPCVALEPIPAGARVWLHMGSSFDAAVSVEGDLKSEWESYCCIEEDTWLTCLQEGV
ncbi:uncharacterized protein Tco025E_05342 [Trypanosoma conorhini]|uniref:Uncharacterized protein n=1 Tax=Trypanosoma conorhini TaxID=83891 RepID=A0A3R7KYF2_9TRYP|nr:uncharacterized protein Tco025E_05342 [Trypanosoma conorhini]RNF15907.1 hypothetical protein Tco025E_05342 [Trypanosoma conorhini]